MFAVVEIEDDDCFFYEHDARGRGGMGQGANKVWE